MSARFYTYQAVDSVTGDLYTWTTTSPRGAGYPGPNTATQIARLADVEDQGGEELLAETPDSQTIAASGGANVVLTWDLDATYGRSIQGFTIRATVYSGTAVQYHVERRLTVAINSSNAVSASEGAQLFAMASGWTLTNGASGSTITATLSSQTASAQECHISISRHYVKQLY